MPPEPSGEEDLAGCFIHAWSATIYLYTIVRGFLGITPHAPESVTICPYLASDWKISVKRLAVGESLLSFELRWDGTDVVATVRNEGNVIDVDFSIVVPVIADCLSATVNGVRVDVTTEINKGRYTRIMTRFPLEKEDVLDKKEIKNIIFKMVNNK